jgi:hypothetical protein
MTVAHPPISAYTDDDIVGTRKGRVLARTVESQSMLNGRITSSPWEGLYLEAEDAASATEDTPQVNTQLEQFLTSLMFGE